MAACCVLLGGGLFCVNFAGGVAEAEVFEGVEDLAVCFWIGIFGLVEKAVVVFEAGIECGIESCKDFFLSGDGSVFMLETVAEDAKIVDENKRKAVNLIPKNLTKTKRISFTFNHVSCLFIYLFLSLHTNLRLWPIIKQQKKKLKLS